jgi:hypothetical protein
MAGKSVSIDTKALEDWFANVQAWVIDFFNTMDTYEMIALGGIGLGLILLIVGLIIM